MASIGKQFGNTGKGCKTAVKQEKRCPGPQSNAGALGVTAWLGSTVANIVRTALGCCVCIDTKPRFKSAPF